MKPITHDEHPTGKEFWSKNKKLGRPMSPHLTIYKPQLTSMLSITHRGTGLAQSGYLSIIGIGSLFLPGNFPSFLAEVSAMHFGPALIFILSSASPSQLLFTCGTDSGTWHGTWVTGSIFPTSTSPAGS